MRLTAPPGDQPTNHHHTTLWPRRCCDRWPPANRVTTIGTVLSDRRRLMQAATYTGWLLLTLAAVTASTQLLLPATIAWAAAHGLGGWALWLTWAAGTLAAVHRGVLPRHRSRTAVHLLHAATVAAVFMAIAAPGGWRQALTATIGAVSAWAIAFLATHRPLRPTHPKPLHRSPTPPSLSNP